VETGEVLSSDARQENPLAQDGDVNFRLFIQLFIYVRWFPITGQQYVSTEFLSGSGWDVNWFLDPISNRLARSRSCLKNNYFFSIDHSKTFCDSVGMQAKQLQQKVKQLKPNSKIPLFVKDSKERANVFRYAYLENFKITTRRRIGRDGFEVYRIS